MTPFNSVYFSRATSGEYGLENRLKPRLLIKVSKLKKKAFTLLGYAASFILNEISERLNASEDLNKPSTY